jgi:hypothetical protein
MATSTDEEANVLHIDRQIENLRDRADSLHALIRDMAESGENTRRQSELFCVLVRTIHSLDAIRACLRA